MNLRMDERELRDIAFAAGRGDQGATTTLIRMSEPAVRGFVMSLAGVAEADDLVQETYLRAFRALPGFSGRSSVRTWLFAIARRVAADHFRRRQARPRTDTVVDWVAAAESTDARELTRLDENVALNDLVDRLSPERREAFVTTKILGLPYAEAAAVCGCPVGTIRSRVARARDDLIAAMT